MSTECEIIKAMAKRRTLAAPYTSRVPSGFEQVVDHLSKLSNRKTTSGRRSFPLFVGYFESLRESLLVGQKFILSRSLSPQV